MKPLSLTLLLLLLTYTHLSLAQTCQSNITADAPDSRYNLKTDGTVLDKKTGLLWMRCALGQTWVGNTCTGSIESYAWQAALQAAESKVFAGHSDWRLPNLKELQSLVESRCYDPAINLTAFPTTNYAFWSSSPVAVNSYNAWDVNFTDGNGDWDSKYSTNYVRLVRSGQ